MNVPSEATSLSESATTTARVDVLIPVHNGASTIESSLRSICNQTLRDLRILVVDDGSTDETPILLRRLAAEDARIEIVRTANFGIVDALNLALSLSTADLIARHDADDLAFPERLERQVAYLALHPECVALGCNAFHIDAAGARLGPTTGFDAEVVGDPFHTPSKEPYLMHPFLLARRSALMDAGGYRHVFHAEDTDLYWRLSSAGTLANLTELLGEYRVHADSISARSILNGRIAAVSSQRAAISERRRRDGRPDVSFDKAMLSAYDDADRLDPILDLATSELREDEAAWLRMASAAKLLQLSSYRPYRMTLDDLVTIRRIVEREYGSLSLENRLWIVFRYILGPRRVLRRPLEAWRLVPWKVMPRAMTDLLRYLPRRAQAWRA